MNSSLKHRRDVFMKLLDMGSISAVTLDMSCSNELVRLLDSGLGNLSRIFPRQILSCFLELI